jgi:hypothetical protein
LGNAGTRGNIAFTSSNFDLCYKRPDVPKGAGPKLFVKMPPKLPIFFVAIPTPSSYTQKIRTVEKDERRTGSYEQEPVVCSMCPLVRRRCGEKTRAWVNASGGTEVGKPVLVEFYNDLPRPGVSESGLRAWGARAQGALEKYERRVRGRYNEGTLQRLLESPFADARRAAVVALGLIGTMDSNRRLAGRLRDEDRAVRVLAGDALWSLWLRGDNRVWGQQLRRIMRLNATDKALNALTALIKKAPRFAEAYNQRAIVYFRLEEFPRAIADCDAALKLNPFHFGALAGMGQSYMKLKRPRAALKAFRAACQIHPGLEGIQETIHFLEEALGEEGRKDDNKK